MSPTNFLTRLRTELNTCNEPCDRRERRRQGRRQKRYKAGPRFDKLLLAQDQEGGQAKCDAQQRRRDAAPWTSDTFVFPVREAIRLPALDDKAPEALIHQTEGGITLDQA